MNRTGLSLLIAGLVWGVMASAQSTATGQNDSGLFAKKMGDWLLNCQLITSIADVTSARSCQVSQEVQQDSDAQRLLLVSIAKPELGRAAVVQVTAPFGLDLSQGMSLLIGEDLIANAPFKTCLPTGCIVRFELDPAAMYVIEDTKTIILRAHLFQSDELISFPLSMAGFNIAWNRLSSLLP